MALKQSLSKQLQAAEKDLEKALRYGDQESVDMAKARISSLEAQSMAAQRCLAERGTLGEFSSGSVATSAVVRERRKRSAVVVGGQCQLPLVADERRAAPNCVLRGAVFPAIKKGARALMLREPVAMQEGYEVIFSGGQLDQADLDVWLHCLHLSRDRLGERVDVGVRAFLDAIGRTDGAASHSWLRDSLVRLGMAVIQVKHEGRTVMLPDRMVVYDESEQVSKSTLSLRVSPTMAHLFGVASWTALEFDVRKLLVGKPLAQWLHAYLATHRQPIPIAVDTLRELSGSRAGELREFRRALKESVEKLVEVGFLRSWSINKDDRLHAVR